MSLYKLVFGKACHLLVELERRSLWALRHLNFDIEAVETSRFMELHELDEFFIAHLKTRGYQRENEDDAWSKHS